MPVSKPSNPETGEWPQGATRPYHNDHGGHNYASEDEYVVFASTIDRNKKKVRFFRGPHSLWLNHPEAFIFDNYWFAYAYYLKLRKHYADQECLYYE